MFRQVNLLISGVLLLLQLLLPVFAPQLHLLTGCDDNCCVAGHVHAGASGSAEVLCGAGACRKNHSGCPDHFSPAKDADCPWHTPAGKTGESGVPWSHDCTSCAICQVLFAPRCIVAVVSVDEFVDQVRLVVCPTIVAVSAEAVYSLPVRAPPVA